MAITYHDLYLKTRMALSSAGIEAAQLEAREIVCAAAGKSRDQFYRDLMLYASDQVEEKTAELLPRQAAAQQLGRGARSRGARMRRL